MEQHDAHVRAWKRYASGFRVLRPRHADENKVLASIIRNIAEMVEDDPDPVSGVAVAVVWTDGTVGSVFDGSSYCHLLGSLSYLQARIQKVWEEWD